MKTQTGDQRKIKISFWRMSLEISKAFATIKSNPRRSTFISTFNELNIKNFDVSNLDFFPYITASNEKTSNDTDTKAGAEVFWKIDSGSQLNVALNPDFGQVESDDVVINFSAMETFYADKRPFFSENQSMFDVDGYRFLYVINTRRIGASPDYNCSDYSSELEALCSSSQEGNTDINLAFRYTKVGQGYDLGFLGAFESDEAFSQGRDYFATRYRIKKENLSFGYLGTFTKNEVLGRNANVNTVDMVYLPTEDFRLYAILLNSIVEDNKGYGLRISIRKQVNQDLSTGLGIYYLELSALGGLLFGAGFTLIISVLFGLFALRTSGVSFLIVTLMFGQTFYLSILYFNEFTFGQDGFSLAKYLGKFVIFNKEYLYSNPDIRYNFALILLTAYLLISTLIIFSPVGRVLIAIRENESRTQLLGYNVFYYKLFALVLSGTFSGVAGAMHGLLFSYIGTTFAEIHHSISPLLWTLLGGAGTVIGPLIGTGIMYYLIDFIGEITKNYLLVVGIVLILMIIWFPLGIMGSVRRKWLKWLP
jgi:branched-chain amino acid transport system permease protein